MGTRQKYIQDGSRALPSDVA
eukprot:COSAG02_NODE_47114_length_343_cov_1.229508_2_plen_20_part_01